MQSKSHKRFSRLSTTVLVVVTLIVVIWLVANISDSVPNPLSQPDHPGQYASTTAVVAVPAPSVAGTIGFRKIQTPGGTIAVEVADTDPARERGLSGRPSLAKDSGMLFVFPEAGVYGFWMKEMKIPIDMVWIGADQKVSGVVPGVSPSTFPDIFYPPADVLYVLELASGAAADLRIATGTQLAF